MNHIIFSKVKIENKERRKRKGYGSQIPNKDYSKHGLSIQNSINMQVKKIKEKSEKFEFNPYLLLKIELEDDIQFSKEEEEKLELFGLKIIDKESNRLQVVFSKDLQLTIFKEELLSYKNGKKAKTKVKNNDLFAKIKNINEWSKEDRLALNINDISKESYIDVYLWVFDNVNTSQKYMNEFISYVSKNNARLCDNYVGNSVVVARVNLNKNNSMIILEKILEHPLVYKVEPIRKINILLSEIPKINNMQIDEIEFDNSLLNPDTSPSICVIDSGIYQQHPLFKGVIGDSKTFYLTNEIDNSSNDLSGHGTKVASICEYGDFNYNDVFRPQIYLHNAKIHNGQYANIIDLWQMEVKTQIKDFNPKTEILLDDYFNGMVEFDDVINSFDIEQRPYVKMVYSKYSTIYEKLLPTQMREIVEYFYDNYACRIYNLSQGDEKNVYIGDKPKAWSCVLDELQNEYDVIFVVSAGNYIYNNHINFDNILQDYPKYFYTSNECKIIEPANSISSITVGGLAISETIYNTLERINKLPISKINELASITRVGPGIRKSIKPDFIAYSGDIGIENDFLNKKKLTENIGLSKLTFNNDINGLFNWGIGTSFAAPYISHLAANIIEKYPDSSNNLIRAILTSSSVIPSVVINKNKQMKKLVCNSLDEFKHQGLNNENKMLYFTTGYGVPNKKKCLESFENRVVLLADVKKDPLPVDNMHIFEIPLPNEFKQIKGKKRVIIALAFNPKVKNTRIDYAGVSMGFKLIKGKSLQEVVNIYESQKNKKFEKINNTFECTLEPGSTLRNKGTLQKGTFEFSLDSNFNNQNLFLVVNCKKEWDDTPQKYAVVVTLETDDEKVQLYDVIKNRIEQKVTNQVRV